MYYLIPRTTQRVRKYLHFTEEETKAQRVIIKDPLINGCGGIQAPFFFFFFTRIDSTKYFPKICQKEIFTYKNLCVKGEGGILFISP